MIRPMRLLVVEDDDGIAAAAGGRAAARGLRRGARRRPGPPPSPRPSRTWCCWTCGCPTSDGYTVAREMRARSRVPIIMVTAKGEEVDRVIGLELGADDYVVKPFGLRELVARIHAVMRRVAERPRARPGRSCVGDARDRPAPARRCASTATSVALTPKEFDLLEPARRRPGRRASTGATHPGGGLGHALVRAVQDHRRPRLVAAAQARRPRLDRDGPRRRLPPALAMTRRLVATYLILARGGAGRAGGAARDRPRAQPAPTTCSSAWSATRWRWPALVEDTPPGRARSPATPTLRRIVGRYAASTGARVVVVGAGGPPAGRLGRPRASWARDFSTRPEIATALDGGVATGTRRSDTLDTDAALRRRAGRLGRRRCTGRCAPACRPRASTRSDRRYWLILGGVALVVLAAVAVAGPLAGPVGEPPAHRPARRHPARRRPATWRCAPTPTRARRRCASWRSAFNDMVSRLDLLVGTQEQFVADASHQLRSPLTALRLRIENLRARGRARTCEDELDERDRRGRPALAPGQRPAGAGAGRPARARARRAGARRRSLDERARGVAAPRRPSADVGARGADAAPGLRGARSPPGALEQVLDNLHRQRARGRAAGARRCALAATGRDGGGGRVEVTDARPGHGRRGARARLRPLLARARGPARLGPGAGDREAPGGGRRRHGRAGGGARRRPAGGRVDLPSPGGERRPADAPAGALDDPLPGSGGALTAAGGASTRQPTSLPRGRRIHDRPDPGPAGPPADRARARGAHPAHAARWRSSRSRGRAGRQRARAWSS